MTVLAYVCTRCGFNYEDTPGLSTPLPHYIGVCPRCRTRNEASKPIVLQIPPDLAVAA